VEAIFEYPETEVYGGREAISVKHFYQSGALQFSRNQDSSQSWSEDGELMQQFIDSKKNDTTFYYRFSKHDNRTIALRSLEKSYPTIFYSDFNREYQGKGFASDVIYKEEFYENGRRKLLYRKDTTMSWHQNGVLKSKKYANGKIEYDSLGGIVKKSFEWKTKGPSNWSDLKHGLYLTYNSRGAISQIHYTRDEPTKDGFAPGVHYHWKWNDLGKLIEAPKKWKEPLPWKRFSEIEIRF
jgi:hypothetical protein